MMNNDNKDIDEMMKSATENIDDSVSEDKVESGWSSSKKAILIGGGIMSGFALILVVGSLALNKTQLFEDKTQSPDMEQGSSVVSKDGKWDFEYPLDTHDWANQEYDVTQITSDSEIYKDILNYAQSIPGFDNSVSWMPSSVKGEWQGAGEPYTSDVLDKMIRNEAGESTEELNPLYKRTVKEDYQIAYATYIERFINPTFGGWLFAQRAPGRTLYNDKTFNVLKDAFHEDWWTKNIKENEDYSKLPLIVDWKADDFGGLEFAERVDGRYGTFFGKIDETDEQKVESQYVGVSDNGTDIIEVSTPIKYVAFGKDEEVVKNGTIKLRLSGKGDESVRGNRVVITDVEFTVR